MPRELGAHTTVMKHLREDFGKHCIARKAHMDGYYANHGDPDIYGCLRGRMFVIEMKKDGEESRKLQKARSIEWERAGARVFRDVVSWKQIADDFIAWNVRIVGEEVDLAYFAEEG